MSFELNRLANRLDWNLLRTFMVIVQERSITGAAQRLSVTQPSVSASLRRLEERLDVQLIERRSGRAFVITNAGEKVYREVLEIYGGVVRLNGLRADEAHILSGNIVIYRSSHLSASFLNPVIADFQRDNPAVTFSLITANCTDVIRALQQRVASLGFCTRLDSSPQFQRHKLAAQAFGYFCGNSHPLFEMEAPDSDVLARSTVVSFEGETLAGSLSEIARHRARHDIGDTVVASTSSIVDLLGLLRHDEHIGCISTAHAAEYAPDLWQIPLSVERPMIDVYTLMDTDRHFTPAEQAFVAKLADLNCSDSNS